MQSAMLLVGEWEGEWVIFFYFCTFVTLALGIWHGEPSPPPHIHPLKPLAGCFGEAWQKASPPASLAAWKGRFSKWLGCKTFCWSLLPKELSSRVAIIALIMQPWYFEHSVFFYLSKDMPDRGGAAKDLLDWFLGGNLLYSKTLKRDW